MYNVISRTRVNAKVFQEAVHILLSKWKEIARMNVTDILHIIMAKN